MEDGLRVPAGGWRAGEGVPSGSANSPGIWGRNGERPQLVVCCRAGDETGGLGLEETRKNEDKNIAKLLGWLWQGCLLWLAGSQRILVRVGS